MARIHLERLDSAPLELKPAGDLDDVIAQARHLLRSDRQVTGAVVFDNDGVLVWSLRLPVKEMA